MSMKKIDLEMMSVDDLWSLHEEVSRILSSRITSEKRELEKRLAVLNRGRRVIEGGDAVQSYNANGEARRKYPRGSFRNIAILRRRTKHGRAAGSNHVGWPLR